MNVQKYTASQLGQMLTHYNRNNGEERNYSNENIDKSRTHENYNLAPVRDISEIDFINNRIDEVKHINRADVIKMATWIVTLPKDYKGDSMSFFEQSYKALSNRYGEQNVISSWVHMDEKQPHMHFAFVPVVRTVDRSGNHIEKLSAKELINREELKQMHPYMERCLTRNLGEPVHLLNEATREGNKAVSELKRDTVRDNLQKAEAYERMKDIEIQPDKPKRTLFRGNIISYEHHTKRVEKLNATVYQEQRKNTELQKEVNDIQTRYQNCRLQLQHEHNRADEFERMLQAPDPKKEYRTYCREHDIDPMHEQEHTRTHRHEPTR